MNTRYQSQLWMSAIVLVMAIGQGCTTHSVGYTVDSEGQGMGQEMGQDGVAMDMDGTSGSYPSGRSFYESGESYDPGAVGSARGYGWGVTPDGTDIKNGAYNFDGVQYVDPETGMAYNGGSDYGHNYSGVPGYGSNNGPVTGFGNGSADSINPTPEEWAEAFLRGNGASGVGTSEGGLVSEHVDQDVLIAKQHGSGANGMMYHDDGGIHQSTHDAGSMNGSNGSVQDVYFAFDSWKISKEGVNSLLNDADWLKANPGKPVTIEGHCDERGTQDYNMVLGKKRAEAAKSYLVDLGVDASRLRAVSYGKERPFCSEQNESCYQQNRRGHMAVQSY